MSTLVTGQCLCGNFGYQYDRSKVVSAHHCHCKDCQRATGSGKASFVVLPTDAFEGKGETKAFTVIGTNGSHVTRVFCPNCGTPLFSQLKEMPGLHFVKTGTLDDSSWVNMSSSFWGSSASPWSPADANIPVSEKNPG